MYLIITLLINYQLHQVFHGYCCMFWQAGFRGDKVMPIKKGGTMKAQKKGERRGNPTTAVNIPSFARSS